MDVDPTSTSTSTSTSANSARKPSSKTRHTNHARSRDNTRSSSGPTFNFNLGSGAGGKRKMPYPDFFDISGLNPEGGNDNSRRDGGGRGGKKGRHVWILQDEAYFFCCLSEGLSDEGKENEPWHGRKETAMAFNITTRTRGLQANALLGVIEGFFLVFSSSSSSNFAIIPAPGFLWPDCVCKRSEAFLGRSEERRMGFGIAYCALVRIMALGF
jgi:hypothetical protein